MNASRTVDPALALDPPRPNPAAAPLARIRPIRVLHLNAGNMYGGIERMLTTLATERHHAPEMEPEFGLCFPGRARDELLAAGVPVHDLGAVRLSRPWTVLAARRRLALLLREGDVDVAITHGCWNHAVFGPAVRRFAGSTVAASGRNASPGPARRLVHWVHGEMIGGTLLERLAAMTPPDLLIANSQFTAGTIRRVFASSPIEIVHPPLAPWPRFDREAVRRSIRREFETPAHARVIVLVGRMEKIKGHSILLEALSLLPATLDWRCWIVGGASGPKEQRYFADLRRRAVDLGLTERIRWTGARDDVPQILTAADVYCQPNTGPEGYGLTFVEALRAGLPVITTDIGAAREVVGDRGVLVNPGDVKTLVTVLNNEVNRLTSGWNHPDRDECHLKSLALALRGGIE
jgi:glycosyltransferase involved in cell wall biosynthesis